MSQYRRAGRHKWHRSLVATAGVAFAISSCAAPADTTQIAPAAGPQELRYPALNDADWDTFSRSSIWLADPAAGLTPSVSSEAALASLARNGLGSHFMIGTPDVALKIVTNDLLRNADPEEGLTGGFDNRLAWVILYHASTPISPDANGNKIPPESCIFLVTVDAATADVLTLNQSCGGPADTGYSPPRP